MDKTPEELAEEYASSITRESERFIRQDISFAFFSGYQAAKDQYEAKLKEVSANWTFCCEDKARLLQEIAAASPMPVTIFPTSGQWISVKDRLPEEDVAVLTYGQVLNDPPDVIGVRRRYNGDQDWKHTWESEDGFIYREDDVTHWMPLPKPPEEK